MADSERLVKVGYAIEQTRVARQMAAASLHGRKAELEAFLVSSGAYSATRKQLQKEIATLSAILTLLCRQEPEDDDQIPSASGDPPSD